MDWSLAIVMDGLQSNHFCSRTIAILCKFTAIFLRMIIMGVPPICQDTGKRKERPASYLNENEDSEDNT